MYSENSDSFLVSKLNPNSSFQKKKKTKQNNLNCDYESIDDVRALSQFYHATLAIKTIYSSADVGRGKNVKTEAVLILLLISTTILIPVTKVPQWLSTFPFLGQHAEVQSSLSQ